MGLNRSKLKATELAFVDTNNIEYIVHDFERQGLVARTKNQLKAALSKLGSNNGTICIVDIIDIDEDLTIPENISLKFFNGGILNVLTQDIPDENVGTGDGSTTEFSLAYSPVLENSETIYVDGTEQTRNTDYTINYENGIITFTSAPANGASITADYTRRFKLTINGGIDAGLFQIFSGDGVVTGNPKIEAVYPEWFGAKGDGVTDDTEAIQRAVNFWKTLKDKGFVFCQEYNISSTLVISVGTSVWSNNGYHGGVIKGKGKLIGNGQSVILDIVAVERLTIEKLTIEGTGTETGIRVDGSLFVQIIDNEFNNLLMGCDIQSTADNHETNVIANRFTTQDVSNSIGINLNSVDCYIFDNVIRGFETGIKVIKPAHVISRNHIYRYPSSTYNYCIDTIDASTKLIITDNYFDNPSLSAIRLYDPSHLTVADNFFLDNSDATFVEIVQNTASDMYGVKIVNNTLINGSNSSSPNFITYPSESFISSSKRTYIKDNSFSDIFTNKKSTTVCLVGSISDGNSSTNFNLANWLLGYDKLASISAIVDGVSDFYATYDSGTNILYINTDTTVTGDKDVYVTVVSRSELQY